MIDSSFGAQFWPDLAATFLGVVLGIAAGLAVDRWRENRARRRREADLRTALCGAVERNLKICEPLRSVAGSATPIYRVDVGLIDDVFPQLVEVSTDVPLLEVLDQIRYSLREINRALDSWLQIEHENGWRQRQDLLDLRTRLTQLIERDAAALGDLAKQEPLSGLLRSRLIPPLPPA